MGEPTGSVQSTLDYRLVFGCWGSHEGFARYQPRGIHAHLHLGHSMHSGHALGTNGCLSSKEKSCVDEGSGKGGRNRQ
jgi:hypothetical protein